MWRALYLNITIGKSLAIFLCIYFQVQYPHRLPSALSIIITYSIYVICWCDVLLLAGKGPVFPVFLRGQVLLSYSTIRSRNCCSLTFTKSFVLGLLYYFQVWDLLLLYFLPSCLSWCFSITIWSETFKLVLLQNHLSWCFFVTKRSVSCCSCTFTKSCVLMLLYRQESILAICCLPSPKIIFCSASLSVIYEICTSAPDQPDDQSGVLRWLSVSISRDWC